MRKKVAKNKNADEIIVKIISDLDQEQALYQTLYRKYHGKEDLEAKHTYRLLVDVCELIRVNLKGR